MLAYCSRCERETSASHNNPGLRRWARIYFFLGMPFIPLIPIIGSDFAVMLPLTMVYLLGMGPALRVIREPASCDTCGADVERARPTPA
ncbi:MAG: hypothetical protein KC420_07880 [Myxococcales bacterium]|nr:hypothetical protein [Myxococcales bacterium]